jgi:hypothetical protein
MRRLALICGSIILGCWSLHATAQGCSQDFSGEWTREAPAGATPDELYRAAGSGWGNLLDITRDGPRVTIEYAFFSRGDMQPPLKFSYAPGADATVNTVMMGHGVQRQVSTARWSDCRLVIATRHAFEVDGVPTESLVTQTLWLESPDRLVVESARGADGANRTIYRRVVPGA